jgi:hypothetical protein
MQLAGVSFFACAQLVIQSDSFGQWAAVTFEQMLAHRAPASLESEPPQALMAGMKPKMEASGAMR